METKHDQDKHEVKIDIDPLESNGSKQGSALFHQTSQQNDYPVTLNPCAASIGRCYQRSMVLPIMILMNITMMIPAFGKVSGVWDLDELVVYGSLILAMLANSIQAWVIQQAPFKIYSMLVASVNAMKKTITELRVLRDDLKIQIDNLKQKLQRLSAQVDRFASENSRLEKQVGGLKIINQGLATSLDSLTHLEPALRNIADHIKKDLQGSQDALGLFYEKLLKLDVLQNKFESLYQENVKLLSMHQAVTTERQAALDRLNALVQDTADDEMVEQVGSFLEEIDYLKKMYQPMLMRLASQQDIDEPTHALIKTLDHIFSKVEVLAAKFCGPQCRINKAKRADSASGEKQADGHGL